MKRYKAKKFQDVWYMIESKFTINQEGWEIHEAQSDRVIAVRRESEQKWVPFNEYLASTPPSKDLAAIALDPQTLLQSSLPQEEFTREEVVGLKLIWGIA